MPRAYIEMILSSKSGKAALILGDQLADRRSRPDRAALDSVIFEVPVRTVFFE